MQSIHDQRGWVVCEIRVRFDVGNVSINGGGLDEQLSILSASNRLDLGLRAPIKLFIPSAQTQLVALYVNIASFAGDAHRRDDIASLVAQMREVELAALDANLSAVLADAIDAAVLLHHQIAAAQNANISGFVLVDHTRAAFGGRRRQ